MGKARPKPESNPRSRAARRANSPSLNTDKSLKEHPRASDATPVLKPFQNGGIQKKAKKKHLTHAQRMRHERGIQKAEAVSDRTELKVQDAKSRLRRRQNRRAMWEEVNEDSKEETRKTIKAPGRDMEAGDEVVDEIEAYPGDTEIKVIDGVLVPSFATGQAMNVAVAPAFAASKTPGSFGVTSKTPGTFGISQQPSQEPPTESAKTEVDEIT